MIQSNKIFLKAVGNIAVPIVVQNFVTTTLNMVDTVMIGVMGEKAIASVGIANRLVFIYFLCVFGLYSGVSVYISQYWGVKDVKSIRKVMGIESIFGFGIGALFLILSFTMPRQILGLFSDDPEVIEQAVKYLHLVSPQFLITPVTNALGFNARAVHRAKWPMVASIIALGTNTALNYILINGRLGVPALGITGAAYATIIARTMEMTILIMAVYHKKSDHPLAASFKELSDWDLKMMKSVIKTALPVVVNESFWAVGTSVYYIAYGLLGTDSIAVVQVAYVVADMFQALFLGIGHAAGVMVGNEIGRENYKEAYGYAKKSLLIAVIFTTSIIFIPILFSDFITSVYALKPETGVLLKQAIIVIVTFLPIKAFNFTLIVGILRNGGDTRYCMRLEIFSILLVGIPMAFISVSGLGLNIAGALCAVQLEELVKAIFVSRRFKSRKWMNNIIKEKPTLAGL